jgi:hypothetical protein
MKMIFRFPQWESKAWTRSMYVSELRTDVNEDIDYGANDNCWLYGFSDCWSYDSIYSHGFDKKWSGCWFSNIIAPCIDYSQY